MPVVSTASLAALCAPQRPLIACSSTRAAGRSGRTLRALVQLQAARPAVPAASAGSVPSQPGCQQPSSAQPALVAVAAAGGAGETNSFSAATVVAAAAVLLSAGPAMALDIHMEPSNALSLPTWAVHTSSVLEWVTAMGLMWRYGEVSGNPRWKGMAWGMLPCLGSAMCACTWHFFYNSPDLEFLVALQAFLTVAGNFTCWWAAYRIYKGAQEQGA